MPPNDQLAAGRALPPAKATHTPQLDADHQKHFGNRELLGQLQPFRTETGIHEAEGELTLRFAHLIKADTLSLVKVTVIPFPPL